MFARYFFYYTVDGGSETFATGYSPIYLDGTTNPSTYITFIENSVGYTFCVYFVLELMTNDNTTWTVNSFKMYSPPELNIANPRLTLVYLLGA